MTTAVETLRLGTLYTIHAIRRLRHAVVAVCLWLWSTGVYLVKHKGSKLECIQKDVKKLKKLPIHLALVMNERQVSHADLGRLVTWCFSVGIHYVSVFDPRGVLKSEMESLRQAVEWEHAHLFSGVCEPAVIVSSSDDYQGPTPHNEAHSLLVLGPEDSHVQLTDVARSLCELVQQRNMTSRDVDTHTINNRLIGTNGGYPDPSLAVVIGTPPSLLGYRPWHTRLTEILFIESHHKITYQQFYSLLYRYANTTQRFGK